MRLLIILIALTIAIPVSISQAAQLFAPRVEASDPASENVKTSSAETLNRLSREQTRKWVSGRLNGLPVRGADGGAVGTVQSIVMADTSLAAIRIERPEGPSVLLPYGLFARDFTGVEGELKLSVPLETALSEDIVRRLNNASRLDRMGG